MFYMILFFLFHVLSRVPMISTSGDFTYNEWVQGSKIVHFIILAPVRLTISSIFRWTMSHFSSIPREANIQNWCYYTYIIGSLFLAPILFILKKNGPYFIPIYLTCNELSTFNGSFIIWNSCIIFMSNKLS